MKNRSRFNAHTSRLDQRLQKLHSLPVDLAGVGATSNSLKVDQDGLGQGMRIQKSTMTQGRANRMQRCTCTSLVHVCRVAIIFRTHLLTIAVLWVSSIGAPLPAGRTVALCRHKTNICSWFVHVCKMSAFFCDRVTHLEAEAFFVLGAIIMISG